jgi:hypothetical protein
MFRNALAATMRDTLVQMFKVPELTLGQDAITAGGRKGKRIRTQGGDNEPLNHEDSRALRSPDLSGPGSTIAPRLVKRPGSTSAISTAWPGRRRPRESSTARCRNSIRERVNRLPFWLSAHAAKP